MIRRQLSIALENFPGRLAAISTLIAEHSINIEAITLIDNVEQGVIRLLTSDPARCKSLLVVQGFHVIEADVLVVDLIDHAGQLALVSQSLAEAGINIDYAYGSVATLGEKTRIVFKVSGLEKAIAIIQDL
jgi:hypothetical protein